MCEPLAGQRASLIWLSPPAHVDYNFYVCVRENVLQYMVITILSHRSQPCLLRVVSVDCDLRAVARPTPPTHPGRAARSLTARAQLVPALHTPYSNRPQAKRPRVPPVPLEPAGAMPAGLSSCPIRATHRRIGLPAAVAMLAAAVHVSVLHAHSTHAALSLWCPRSAPPGAHQARAGHQAREPRA